MKKHSFFPVDEEEQVLGQQYSSNHPHHDDQVIVTNSKLNHSTKQSFPKQYLPFSKNILWDNSPLIEYPSTRICLQNFIPKLEIPCKMIEKFEQFMSSITSEDLSMNFDSLLKYNKDSLYISMTDTLEKKNSSLSISCTFKSLENKHYYSTTPTTQHTFGNELKVENLYQISLQIFQLSHSIKVKAELHVPNIDCEPVHRIHSIPLEQSPLANFLTGPGNEICRTGFISMNKTRKLVLLSEHDTARFEIPLIGVWICGIEHIKDSKIITCISRFINHQHYQKNFQPYSHQRESFLLLTFNREGKCDYYDCPISLQEYNSQPIQIWTSSCEIKKHSNHSVWMEFSLQKAKKQHKLPIHQQVEQEEQEEVVVPSLIKGSSSPYRDRSTTPHFMDYNHPHNNTTSSSTHPTHQYNSQYRHSIPRMSVESSFSHYHAPAPPSTTTTVPPSLSYHPYHNVMYPPTQPNPSQPTIFYVQQPSTTNTTSLPSHTNSEFNLVLKLVQEQMEMIRELSYQCKEMKTEMVQLKLNQKNLEQILLQQWNQKQSQQTLFEQSNLLLPMNDSLLLQQQQQPSTLKMIPKQQQQSMMSSSLEDSLLFIAASSNGKRMHQPIVTTTTINANTNKSIPYTTESNEILLSSTKPNVTTTQTNNNTFTQPMISFPSRQNTQESFSTTITQEAVEWKNNDKKEEAINTNHYTVTESTSAPMGMENDVTSKPVQKIEEEKVAIPKPSQEPVLTPHKNEVVEVEQPLNKKSKHKKTSDVEGIKKALSTSLTSSIKESGVPKIIFEPISSSDESTSITDFSYLNQYKGHILHDSDDSDEESSHKKKRHYTKRNVADTTFIVKNSTASTRKSFTLQQG